MTRRSLPTILIALAALALLVPAGAAARERTVAASGEATLKVPNDTAAVGFGVSREGRTRGAALRAVAAGARNVIAAAERVPGVEPGDIVTGRVAINRVQRGKRVSFRASEGVAVTLHEPQRAGELINAAVTAGATGISGPRFFVGDTDAAFNQALAKAYDTAQAKASTLAAKAGGTLGAALTIDEGDGPEILPIEFKDDASAPVRSEGAPPVRPGRSTVTATVHVVFELL